MGQKAPPGLGTRGRRMWRETVLTWSLTPPHMVLLEEACRTADRLDELAEELRGAAADPEERAALFAEIRAQSNSLKGMLAELRQGQRMAGGESGRPQEQEGGGVADLSARIAARRKQTSG